VGVGGGRIKVNQEKCQVNQVNQVNQVKSIKKRVNQENQFQCFGVDVDA